MAGQLRSDATTFVVVLDGTDQYVFRAGGSQHGNAKDVCTLGMSKLASAVALFSPIATMDFTGIPPWAKRVTVVFDGLNLSTLATILVQLGSGSFLTTGYSGSITILKATATSISRSDGFAIKSDGGGTSGTLVLALLTGNTWVANGGSSATSPEAINNFTVGRVALSGPLDRVRITSANAAYTFAAGSANVHWE